MWRTLVSGRRLRGRDGMSSGYRERRRPRRRGEPNSRSWGIRRDYSRNSRCDILLSLCILQLSYVLSIDFFLLYNRTLANCNYHWTNALPLDNVDHVSLVPLSKLTMRYFVKFYYANLSSTNSCSFHLLVTSFQRKIREEWEAKQKEEEEEKRQQEEAKRQQVKCRRRVAFISLFLTVEYYLRLPS